MRYFSTVGRWGIQKFEHVIEQKVPNFRVKSNFRSLTSQNISRPKKSIPLIKISLGISVCGILIYDGIVNNFTYVGSAARFFRSVKIVSLISYDYLLLILKENSEDYEKLLKEIHLKSANRILNACLLNGGLYVKVGQGIAAVNHIIPEEFTSTLSKLQDKCLPSTRENVKKLFLEDFGKVPEEIFQEFDYNPIAAASLAQVFKAKLSTGEDVAVKVQYLDLQKRFSSDLGTIIFLQDIIEYFFKNYNFGWIFRNARANLEKELDFINEGKNAERCAKDLSQFDFVCVPKVYWDLTKSRVLTLEWVDGYKITDIENIKQNNFDIKDLDKKLFNVFSEQIFSSGFIHADPHPGNIFIRKSKSGKTQLVLLDHGLYEWLPSAIRTKLCKFWEATVLEDENIMKKTANELEVEEYKTLAEILFQVPFEIEGAGVKSRLTEEDIKYMQNVAKNHFNKIMQTLKEMPSNMILVIRNLNTIRAIAKEHGDPVDRPKLMARYAQKCLYKNQNSFIAYFRWLIRRIRFEYCLLKRGIKLSLISLYLDILYKLGRSPEKFNLLTDVRK